MSIYTNPEPITPDELTSLPRPQWLRNRSLFENVWVIQTDSDIHRRKASLSLNFDVPVAYGDIRLTSVGREHDLLSAKLFMYHAMTGEHAWLSCAAAARRELLNLLIFFQWRLDRGIDRNSYLSEASFREFKRSVTESQLEGLLRSEQRIRRALKHFELAGLPLTPVTPTESRRWLHMKAIFEQAGLSNHLQLGTGAKQQIEDFCKRHRVTSGSAKGRASGTLYALSERKAPRGQTLTRFFRIWQRLSELSVQMHHDPIGHDAFPNGIPHHLGRALGGTPLGNTRPPPPLQASFLVDRALRWVLHYSEDLLAIAESLGKNSKIAKPEGRTASDHFRIELASTLSAMQLRYIDRETSVAAPWPIYGSYRGVSTSTHVPLGDALFRLLPAACAIVIAAFSARRREEIEGLKVGCISEDEEGLWLSAFIVKNRGEVERIPTSRAVSRAVEVLEIISAHRRKRTGSPWVYSFDHLRSTIAEISPAAFQMPRELNYFANFVSVPPLPDGKKWSFAPHQFRRFFAICYFYRFRLRSLSALSYFFRHSNPQHTRAYITGSAAGGFIRMAQQSAALRDRSLHAKARLNDFREGQKYFQRDLLHAVISGRERIGGRGGVQIANDLASLIAKAKTSIEIVSDREAATETTLDRIISDFANGLNIEPHPAGHSYCKCSASQKDEAAAGCVQRAKALGDRQGPPGADRRHAIDTVCSVCPHNIQLEENEAYWHEMIRVADEAAAQASGAAREAALDRSSAGRSHIDCWFGQSN